jgi:nucleoside-diphosphate-sugar epimerase
MGDDDMSGERRAVVTGVAGLVGTAVGRALAHDGWTVRGLVRRPWDDAPKWLGEQWVGDLTSPHTLRGLCADTDLVVHSGAMVSDWAPLDAFWQVNRDGTGSLLDEAQRRRVGRFVWVGTANVFGFRTDTVLHERVVKRCPPFPYPQSKLDTERVVWDYARRGLAVTVVYPSWVFGPGDRHLVPELVARLRAGQFVHIGGGRAPLELTYSENLAEAIILAGTRDEGRGEGFLVGDGYGLTLGGFVEAVASAAGVAPPRFSIPTRAAYSLAAASELVARVTRSESRPMLTRYAVRSLATGVRYDLGKIRALGYRPRIGLDEAVRRAVAAAPAT